MKQYQQKWIKRLRKALTAPNRNYLVWKTVTQILKDDTGQTDELNVLLAKHLDEYMS